jgi:ribosomal protein S18 acetylase RimI-like enzyme
MKPLTSLDKRQRTRRDRRETSSLEPNLRIVAATFADLPRILEIQKEAYKSEAQIYADYSIPPLTQSLANIRAEFKRKPFLKAIVRGRIVGSVRASLAEGTCTVEKLIVEPRHQGKGYGTALLEAAENVFPDAHHCELFTGHRSVANLRLYRRHGYRRYKAVAVAPHLTVVYLRKPRPAE